MHERRSTLFCQLEFANTQLSDMTSEPTDIVRVALHHRSYCLFILHFRHFVVNFNFSGTKTDQTTGLHVNYATHFRHWWIGWKSQPVLASMFLCRAVDSLPVTPRHKWFRQDGTHLSTFHFGRKQVKRLEDSMTFSFYRKFTPYRNKCVRGMINLPFCLLFFCVFFFFFFCQYIQSRTEDAHNILAAIMKFSNRVGYFEKLRILQTIEIIMKLNVLNYVMFRI